jgi:hypothetical protein
MENFVEEIPKDETPEQEQEKEIPSIERRKTWKEKLITLALVGGLFGGSAGCKAVDEKKPVEPIPQNTFEEVQENELQVEQRIGRHPNYTFNFSEEILGNNFEINRYSAFKLQEKDYSLEVQKFTEVMNPSEKDVFGYDSEKETVFMKFEQARDLSAFDINTENFETLVKEIQSKFFTNDLNFKVESVKEENGFVNIQYTPVIEGLPMYIFHSNPYVILDSQGNLKEARFLLAEFEKAGEVSLSSVGDLSKKINNPDYKKSIVFDFVDPSVEEKFGFYGYDATGEEKGMVEVNEVNLAYYYAGKNQDYVVPIYLIDGKGFVEIEGEKVEVNFDVLASALSQGNEK